MDKIAEAYITAQRAFIAEHNLTVGDRVKILKKADSHVMGWGVGWGSSMDETVGMTGTIREIHIGTYESAGINIAIDGTDWNYPWFVLEVLPKQVTVTVGSEEFQVDKEKAEEIRRVITS